MKQKSPTRLWFSKWVGDEWLADPAVSACSPAARGVWMDLLCHAYKGKPVGHVSIDGTPPTIKQLGIMARCNPRALPALLEELEGNGVFSRTPEGVIYSRRIVRQLESHLSAVERGVKGGNPLLIQASNKNQLKPEVELEVELEVDSLAPHAAPGKAAGSGVGKPSAARTSQTRGTRLQDDWRPSEDDRRYAADLGLNPDRVADDFRGYWLAKTGAGATKAGEKGWSLTWQGWCRREAERRGKRPGPAAEEPRRFL